jgi:hypothetical protein
MIVFEQRAATVLFNLIRSYQAEGPFLLPANICPIVPMVIFKARRSFEFIDIEPSTLCIDHDKLAKRCSVPNNKPAGIVYVRSYGALFDATDIFASIKALLPNALIVDDRCLCPPEFSGKLAPHTDAALYSTGYAKYVDVGFGGFGVIRDGIPYTPTEMAYKISELDELTIRYKNALLQHIPFSYTDSAWLDATHPKQTWSSYQRLVEQELHRANAIKIATNFIYSSRLPAEIQFPSAYQSWRFNIQIQDKASLLDAIRRAGFIASGHYDSLAGLIGPGNAPYATTVHDHVINLFNDRYFSTARAEQLTDFLVSSNLLIPCSLFA